MSGEEVLRSYVRMEGSPENFEYVALILQLLQGVEEGEQYGERTISGGSNRA
ncbi:hypothetical protein KIM372_05260 [Bombiscardovia nodaiensis]|uniref:Uncharacterized protein n=1 Tax=Bombiscardovia nodaiensis TaxID=2932181 RepID=A0ABM8B706_9BIFI|nr:hypothetical protein KIM372_05260 [Bombiscardovia nodaiensis]